MRATITQIGNSKGIIIPAQILKRYGFEGEVFLDLKEDKVILSKEKRPREGWNDAFIAQCDLEEAQNFEKDALLLSDFPNDFDEEEWQW